VSKTPIVTFPIEVAAESLQPAPHGHNSAEQETDWNAAWLMTLELNSPTFFLPEFFAGCPEGE
jgi:hypothetical protein